MLFYLDNDKKKIIGYHDAITREEAEKYLTENVKWLDVGVTLPANVPSGKHTIMFLNDDNTIRYVFEDIPQSEPEPLDLESAVKAL